MCRGSLSLEGGRAGSAALQDEQAASGLADDGRQVAIALDRAKIANRETLQERKHNVERHARVADECDDYGRLAHPLAIPADSSIHFLVEIPHSGKGLGLVVRERPRLQDGDPDQLVRITDENPALFFAARVSELDLLAHVHGADSFVERADEERVLFGLLGGGLRLSVPLLGLEILVELFVLFLFEPGFSRGLRCLECARLLRATSLRLAPPRLLLEELLGQLGEEPASLPGESRILEKRVDQRRRREEPRLVRNQRLLGPARGRAGKVQKSLVARRA